jgi:VanZ family protein
VRPVLRLWLPVLAWAALIFALSAIPSLSSGLGTWDLVLRKAAHIIEFAILGALLVRAIGMAAPALVAGVAYAATDEWHQSFVRGREGRPIDIAVDAIGVLVGVLAWRKLQPGSRSRRPATEAAAGSTTSHGR